MTKPCKRLIEGSIRQPNIIENSVQFSCWRYSGRRRAGNTSWSPLPAVRAGDGLNWPGQRSCSASAYPIVNSDVARPSGLRQARRLDVASNANALGTPHRCLSNFCALTMRSVKGLAVPIGSFGSFFLPKEWRLNPYCPSASLHTRVWAKRRRDLEAKLAKDILVK